MSTTFIAIDMGGVCSRCRDHSAKPIQAARGEHKVSTVEEKVVSIVCEQLGVSSEEITRESSFIDDLKADSLDVVELVMSFEDEFSITIPDEDYEKIRTVGDAVDYIEKKQ